MQDALDVIVTAPAWTQACMVLFVLAFLAMMVAPPLGQRRAKRHFDALAKVRGARVVPGDQFTASFPVEHGHRRFTVRRELRSSTRGSSYRGPRGRLVTIETALSSTRWKMHGVDVAQQSALARLGSAPVRSGDAAFDARFTVWQDGVPVRDGWLDSSTRDAFTAFFDLPAVAGKGTVWVQEGLLQYITGAPHALDDSALTTILDRQVALAAALETTAGWRGPTR